MRTVSSCSDRGLGSSMCLPEEGGGGARDTCV